VLLEIAIADAYGAGFEYAQPDPARVNSGRAYAQHPRRPSARVGCYTDDTQLSIAVAECVLAGTTTPAAFADRFVAGFKRDPRTGYARGFQAFLATVRDGPDFMARIRPDSAKSGAAMRAGAIGLLPTLADVLEVAARQARLTHDTPGGVAAAQCAAAMVFHQVRRIGPLVALPAFLAANVAGVDWEQRHAGAASGGGVVIAKAALAVLLEARSLSDILVGAVALGGDTDTVAAIAMSAASVSSVLVRDIAPELIDQLEDGPYGRDFLAGLDRQLAKQFDAPIVAAGPRP